MYLLASKSHENVLICVPRTGVLSVVQEGE